MKDLIDALGSGSTSTNFDSATSILISKKLISTQVVNDVNTMAGLSLRQKSERITKELHRCIQYSPEPQNLLVSTCDAFIEVDDPVLTDTAQKVKNEIDN